MIQRGKRRALARKSQLSGGSATDEVKVRLLHVPSKRFELFHASVLPRFVIISYVWAIDWKDEILFSDVSEESMYKKPGFQRFMAACKLTLVVGLEYLWCDSFCVDQSSSEDMSQALGYMSEYYRRAQICLIYLPRFLTYEPGDLARPHGTADQLELRRHVPTLSNVESYQYLVYAYRIEFCVSNCCLKKGWAMRMLDHISAVSGSSENNVRPVRNTAPQGFSPNSSKIQRAQAKTPIFVNNGEETVNHHREDIRLDHCLVGGNEPTADTASLCGLVNGNWNQPHVEVLKGILREFNQGEQDVVECGSSQPFGDHAPDFDGPSVNYFVPNSQLLSSFVDINPGHANRANELMKQDHSSALEIVELPIRMSKCDSAEEVPGNWVCVGPKDFPEESSYFSSADADTHDITTSLSQHKYVQSKQNVQVSPLVGEPSPSSNPEERIRYWLDSVSSAREVAEPRDGSSVESPSTLTNFKDGIKYGCSTHVFSDTSANERDWWHCFDEWTNLDSSLSPDHPVSGLIHSTVLDALKWFGRWKQVRYRVSGSPTQSRFGATGLATYQQTPVKGKGPPEFACPYYKKDPSKYADCLKRSRLASIDDVKEHVWQNHRIPFYCPICKSDFLTASSRDRHIVKRICVIRDDFPYEGVSDDQRRQLSRRPQKLTPKGQWFQIWKLLLPGVPAPESAILKDDHGQEVVIFREFWSRHGEAVVSRSVGKANLATWDRRMEERDLASLYSEVLKGAVDTIMGTNSPFEHL